MADSSSSIVTTCGLEDCAGHRDHLRTYVDNSDAVVNDDVFEADVENSEVHSDDFGQPCCN